MSAFTTPPWPSQLNADMEHTHSSAAFLSSAHTASAEDLEQERYAMLSLAGKTTQRKKQNKTTVGLHLVLIKRKALECDYVPFSLQDFVLFICAVSIVFQLWL